MSDTALATRRLLGQACDIACRYLDTLDERPVAQPVARETLLAGLPDALPDDSLPDQEVIDELAAAVDPGLVASAGPRYFGYVVGGALPAALAADWLTSAWDQQAGVYDGSPAAALVEEVAARWLRELFQLPTTASVGFVTGTAQGHLVALAAARWRLLDRVGWDVGASGLFGAPPISVLATAERHVTVDAALRHLGIGRAQITDVETDGAGRVRPAALEQALASAGDLVLVCAQAGNVNTGSCDPLGEIADLCDDRGAWLHVDGAFGMWARADPRRSHLVTGLERATSWTTDAHKWLNVPYDCGMVFVDDEVAHVAGMATSAAYSGSASAVDRDGSRYTPEFSRRARGFVVYAALRALGRRGVGSLVARDCDLARRFATAARALDGVEVLNEVELNQVLLRFGAAGRDPDAATADMIRWVQREGTFWAGATRWQGRAAMRVSISGWNTSSADVDRAVEALRDGLATVLVQPA